MKKHDKPKKKGGCLKTVIIAIVILAILGFLASPSDDNTAETQKSAETENYIDSTVESTVEETVADNIPTEYKSALKKAESYANNLHMSKAGIYNQLTSEYGEKFTPEAAQYAIDNIVANWNENALQKAISYQESMAMSPAAIYDQLISEYGEQFTEEEAQYAIDHLE